VPPCDTKHFQLDGMETLDYTTYIGNGILGTRLYLLKEDTDTLPNARKHSKR